MDRFGKSPKSARDVGIARLRYGAALLALLGFLVVNTAGASASGLVRHENQYWTWYAPRGWVASYGAAGINISSSTGTLQVGFAFSAWYQPVTSQEVVTLTVQNGGLDQKPLSNVRLTKRSQPYSFAPGWSRQVVTWSARRNGGPAVEGILKADAYNDPSTATYGLEAYVYDAPKKLWSANRGMLDRLTKVIYYHPQ